MNAPNSVTDFMQTFEVATSQQVYAYFKKRGQSRDRTAKSLFRLRKQGFIISSQVGGLTLNVLARKSSWLEDFSKLTPDQRQSKLSDARIFHGLEVVEAGDLLERHLSGVVKSIHWNDGSKNPLSSDGKKQGHSWRYTPDLIIESFQSKLIAVELERSLKARRRYAPIFEAYEKDPLCLGVLYILSGDLQRERFAGYVRSYFNRLDLDSSFTLGLINFEELQSKAHVSVTIFNEKGEFQKTFQDYVRGTFL